MAWIESHQSLSRHRKTLAVAAALKADRHKIIGHLHELWWWGIDNADINGVIGEVDDSVVAEAAGWPARQASMFVGALIDAGFLDRTEQGLVLHDWYDYAGKLNDQRELRRSSNRDAQQRRRQRLRQQPVSAGGQDDTDDILMTVSASQHPTVPNPTVPNQPNPTLPAGSSTPSVYQSAREMPAAGERNGGGFRPLGSLLPKRPEPPAPPPGFRTDESVGERFDRKARQASQPANGINSETKEVA